MSNKKVLMVGDLALLGRLFGEEARAAELVAYYRDTVERADKAAVRTGQVYAMPQDFLSWDQPDARWGLGLLWLTSKMHP